VAAKAPEPVAASVAGSADPAIAALLRAATARGGNALIAKHAAGVPASIETLRQKSPSELPPDARQQRMLEAAREVAKDRESRRDFLSKTALGVGWAALAIGTGISVGPAFGRFMMPNVLEEPDPRVRVGKLARYLEMKPGEVNEDYKPQGIWMIREEERIAALNIICTHLGCIPNWLPNDRKFKCPCHGSGYKPNGVNFEGPTPRPLERFRILVEDGIVVVDKSQKFQQELGQWTLPASFIAV
jgi:cytochrome b6-f complex iron-sulfur subunit